VDQNCHSCGKAKTPGTEFRAVRRSFRRSGWLCCEPCAQMLEERERRRMVWFNLFAIVFIAATTAEKLRFHPTDRISHLWLNYGLCAAVYVLFIVFHELAHAIAAHFAGCRVVSISVGRGPKLIRMRCGGVDLIAHAIPFGGCMQLAFKRKTNVEMRLFTSVLAAPAFHAAVIAFICLGPFQIHLLAGLEGLRAFKFAEAALIVNTLMLVGNLRPFEIRRDGRTLKSDGLQLWLLGNAILRKKRPAVASVAIVQPIRQPPPLDDGNWVSMRPGVSLPAPAERKSTVASSDDGNWVPLQHSSSSSAWSSKNATFTAGQ